MSGCWEQQRSLMISRTLATRWPQRTELQEPWTSRKTLLQRLRSSRKMLRMKLLSSLKETRYLRMLRNSRMSSTVLPSMSRIYRPKLGMSATSTLKMSSSGLSTELASRSSLLGSSRQSLPPLKVSPSLQTLTRPVLLLIRFMVSRRPASTTLKSWRLLIQLPKKMTTHKEADVEVAELKDRYNKVKTMADDWVKKVDTLVKEWQLLDNTVTELNAWVAKDKTSEGENQFSLEKMESTLGELKNIFKEKEKMVDGL